MRKNEDGFILMIIMLIVLIVVVIGFSATKVLQAQK
jgi:Tfp pilus assembly protein PilX